MYSCGDTFVSFKRKQKQERQIKSDVLRKSLSTNFEIPQLAYDYVSFFDVKNVHQMENVS